MTRTTPDRPDDARQRSSVCSYCGVGCPFTVVTDARGNDRVEPLSDLGLCVKGRTSLLTGGDRERARRLAARGIADDRIRVPMVRGHDGRMREVSWDEALDRAAWLFLHAREWVGPEAVAIYGNGQKTVEAIWMASLYKLVFRMPTVGANSEHCLTSAGAAHQLNFGNEASFTWQRFAELAECDVAVLHGTNAFVTFPQAYEKLVRNRAAIKVVIDPVVTDTVSDLRQQDAHTLHVRFRQGGDVTFNLSVARVLLDHGWEDAETLAARVDPDSVADFRRLVGEDRFAPEVAARTIALPGQDPVELAATIRHFAELVARPRDGHRPRLAYVSSMGVNQSTGTYGFSTNLDLLLLTGNVGRRGAGSLRIAGQSNATTELMLGFNSRRLLFNHDPADPAHRAALARVLDLPEHNVPDAPGTPVARMADDDRLYCMLFVGTQMTRNMPRLGHWARRMGRAFNVVADSFLADGVLEHADVLLPTLTHAERTGVVQRGDRTLQLQQGLTEPPAMAWSDEQVLARLALRIADRLDDPDTAELNDVDPAVVRRVFGRYVDADGTVDPAGVFDHAVEVSRELDLYCRLEDADGRAIDHDLLRERAGEGVQWGGDGRYVPDAASTGPAFPGLHRDERARARLVVPPRELLDRLDAPLPAGTLSLISGRGRPGHRARRGRGHFNSGVKTLPLHGSAEPVHVVEVHPDDVEGLGLVAGRPARIAAEHGVVVADVAANERVARGTAFIDFVPGEVNRLTDYVEADELTHQSMVKRTPVRLTGLRPTEAALWDRPDRDALVATVDVLFADWRDRFPRDEDWVATQREAPGEVVWLPTEQLRHAGDPAAVRLDEAVGAATAFLQRYAVDDGYRQAAADVLGALDADVRDRFLRVLLPLVRRLDAHGVLHRLLADVVGGVRVVDDDGCEQTLDLVTAHRSAVLEFKEEIVAIQLFLAAKRGLEALFGRDAVVRRSDLAFVSGVAIPCAGDVPAHLLGISPADLGLARLVHSRAIGSSAMLVVDRARGRAVRVDVLGGVLPRDPELGRLRGAVINRKRSATATEHGRFFDRLGELVVDHVRVGDDNFDVRGPVALDFDEYRAVAAFAPVAHVRFVEHLVSRGASPALAQGLVGLGVLDRVTDAEALAVIAAAASSGREPGEPIVDDADRLYAGTLLERVARVVDEVVAPVVANDGGRLDVLDVDEGSGVLSIRFVGSCANCPYSLLSMEQIVKPSLLAIPGVTDVVHRARAREREVTAARGRTFLPMA